MLVVNAIINAYPARMLTATYAIIHAYPARMLTATYAITGITKPCIAISSCCS
jgi:hypothetical protein